jgi:hypothetical protein
VEQLAAVREFVLSVAVGEKAKVADADEARGQDVKAEAAEELDGRKGEGFFDTAVAVILPAEADAAVIDLQQAVVGDSHAVGVATEIVDDLGGAAERALGVDHPALTASCPQPAAEGLGIGESGQIAKETELILLEGLEQGNTKQMAAAIPHSR